MGLWLKNEDGFVPVSGGSGGSGGGGPHDTVQLFDVVTALLAKVKQLSAEIEELKKSP